MLPACPTNESIPIPWRVQYDRFGSKVVGRLERFQVGTFCKTKQNGAVLPDMTCFRREWNRPEYRLCSPVAAPWHPHHGGMQGVRMVLPAVRKAALPPGPLPSVARTDTLDVEYPVAC